MQVYLRAEWEGFWKKQTRCSTHVVKDEPSWSPHLSWVCSTWGKKIVNIFFNCNLIKLAQKRALLRSKHSLALYSVMKCTQRAQCGISLHRCRNWIAACFPVTSADHLLRIFPGFFTLHVSFVAVHSSSLSLVPGEEEEPGPLQCFQAGGSCRCPLIGAVPQWV